uniref:Uncharacterized protein n=1 Tax=Arundo donax TaxID=35708 RepID=A0A0A9FJU4_ARUDO
MRALMHVWMCKGDVSSLRCDEMAQGDVNKCDY